MKKDIFIRKATETDAGSIAHLHAISWKSAYKNILPQEYLDNDVESEKEAYWTGKMRNLNTNDFVLLMEKTEGEDQENTLIGFVAVCESNEMGYGAIVDNLHVLPEEKGKKIGLRLLCMAAAELKQQGKDSFYLWVFDQNTAAREFYKKTGGIPVDKGLYEMRGKKIPETRYCWTTLQGLLEIKERL